MPMASRIGGKAKKTSITRPSAWSAARPRPASIPSVPPASSAIAMAAPAMPSETRMPKTTRESRSRPKRSVPKRWPPPGRLNMWLASTAVGE